MKLEPYEEKNIANAMRRCIHFNGLMYLPIGSGDDRGKTCEAGIVYDSVRIRPTLERRGSLPCFTDEAEGTSCAKAQFMSRDEALSDWLETKTKIREWSNAIERGECPTCKVPVQMKQVGHCVYGSCGHRLYQGKLPKRKP